ncbi:hypothetical protein FEDK69T_24510 [Flavobacterium enshiense DK69]|nr:hypothetical protein FEDK69T_24510 [Flavobacterium enshiense DK69]
MQIHLNLNPFSSKFLIFPFEHGFQFYAIGIDEKKYQSSITTNS